MEELTTPKARFVAFLTKKGITINESQAALGLSNGTLYKDATEFKTSTIRKMAEVYPDLNIIWLIFGTGTMELSGEEEPETNDHKKYVEQLEARVQELSEHVADLRDMLHMKKDSLLQASKQAVG